MNASVQNYNSKSEKVESVSTRFTTSVSILDDIREREKTSPLLMAVALKNRVAKVGFDWNCAEGVLEKLDEEVQEVKDAIKEGNLPHIQEEIGDVFFVLSILADRLEINPETALEDANKKFERRFRIVEAKMKEAELSLTSENIDKMEEFWQEAKKEE